MHCSTLRTLMLRFAWPDEQLRVQWYILTLLHSAGGLNAPNFETYYMAAQTMFAYYWMHNPPGPPHLWMERDDAAPMSLPFFLLDRPIRCYQVIDLADTTRYLFGKLADLQCMPLLHSARLPLEWSSWLTLCQERAMLESLQGLYVRCRGDFFENKVLCGWE
ncbi:hypothetical protein NDU88_000973 [Pleurodeles waltl]|uniref:Uncharacterized protein n=1 Tax=Pleurodeles waltl TaxID=8319 RepID=A0AAV7V9L7_PLEWA|nr:hypothetical protein NDU88_000973 [Pleurodeles waltl]